MDPKKYGLKMAILKKTINGLSPRILKAYEKREPQTFPAQILARAFANVKRAMDAENLVGLREDLNFSRLVEASERALLFLAEEDNYYARWLGFLLQQLAREVQDFEARFSYEDALKAWGRPIPLKREIYENHRRQLLDLALSGYLTRIEDLSPEERDALKGGWYFLRLPQPGGT